ncbi:MAG: hypothetical protein ACOCYO_11050 [Bacteroidota bacterium]
MEEVSSEHSTATITAGRFKSNKLRSVSTMRKNREQQKNGMVRQLNLFEDQRKPADCHEGRTGNENRTGVELLSQLENQRTLTQVVT